MKQLHVTPAYGKDFKSAKEAIQAWKDGKDFRVEGISPYSGSYVGKTEASLLKQDGFSGIVIRFFGQRKVAVVKL